MLEACLSIEWRLQQTRSSASVVSEEYRILGPVYWTGPNDGPSAWDATATTAEGFWNRADLVERYAEVSGRDVSQLDFYVAFAYWKLACILEGVYGRYLGGALGEQDPAEFEPFKLQVDAAAAKAEEYVEQFT